MNPLILEKSEETPAVQLDAEKNIFKFANTSWPEDATKFYQPIFDWFEEYFKNPNKETEIDFYLEYFNTASAKQIARLLTVLEKYSDENSILIKWYYEKDDTDMLKAGARYAKLINVNFELLESPELIG